MSTTNGREQVFNEGIKNNDTRPADTSADFLVTQNTDGTLGKIDPDDLGFANTDDVVNTSSEPQTKIGGFTSGGINMTYVSDNWIAIGTSVTFGGTYTNPMSLQLELILTNLGVAGSNSNDIANHYSEIPTLNSGNENSYRLISIEHGINDAAQAIPLATFRTNLEAAITHIKGKNWTNNKILIINGNYCSSAPLIPIQEAYANEAILIAKEQGVQYSDTYNYTKNNGGSALLADGVHPTTAGGEVYARGVVASMQGGGEFTNALSVVNGIVAGKIKTYSDSYANGLTIGKGTGNIVNNNALGFEALLSNTSGVRNTGTGYQSLRVNTTGSNNTGTGYRSLYANTTGTENTGLGWQALLTNTSGIKNTGSGTNALALNTTGSENTGTGYQALISNTSGARNTGNGVSALYSNTTGTENTANGHQAFVSLNSGNNNTALGTNAGRFFLDATNNLTTANNCLFLGHGSKALANSSSNEIVVGYNAVGLGSNSIRLGNTSITKTGLSGNVLVGSDTDSGEKLQITGSAKITGITTFSVSPVYATSPTTSASGYEFISRNTSSGVQEKIPSANVQGTIVAGTAAQYYRGDKTMQDLNPAVIGSVLTGFSAGSGTVAGTDTVLQGFNKLAGNQALKANINSPVLTGVPEAPTASNGTNTNQLATTAFVQDAITASSADIQDIVDATTKTGSIDSGNSQISVFEGAADNRTFSVVSSDGAGLTGNLNIQKNITNISGEGTDYAGAFLIAEGSASIAQTGVGEGTTVVAFDDPQTNTFINFPALPAYAGTYSVVCVGTYTVSTLPTPANPAFAIVTDATAPTYLGTLTGGGSVVCPVFYNGSAWVSH